MPLGRFWLCFWPSIFPSVECWCCMPRCWCSVRCSRRALPTLAFFIAGHVLQGLCTSLLLIAAVPPLVVAFPIAKLRWTAMILNVCIFGAVALGPLVGGIQAQADGWRPLFWIIAGIAAAALVLSLLTFQDAPPADRHATRNPLPVGLAAAGCVALFFGASELLTHSFLDAVTLVPLVGGLALIVVLFVYQYRPSGHCCAFARLAARSR